MRFLGELRKNNKKIEYLCVTCIVQKTNLYDLKELYQHCLDWNVDELVFAPLRNWGAFSAEYYRDHNVLLPKNTLRQKAMKYMEEVVSAGRTKKIKIHTPLLPE